MLQSVCRNHNITDIDPGVQRTCNSRIDDAGRRIAVRQNLSAHGRIYLADAGTDYHRVLSFQLSLIKFHAGPGLHLYLCHFFL